MNAEERRDETWNQRYEELAAFQRENGHCRVPRAYNKQLCVWVYTQRQYFDNRLQGISPSISDGRIQRLEAIGFIWSIRKAPPGKKVVKVVFREEGWDDMYEILLDYLNSFNTTDVPMGYVHNEKQLGYWVQGQRNNFHNSSEGKEPGLPDNRRTKLELINFDFRPLEARKLLTKDQSWDDMYYAAVFFHEDHGHFRVSNNFFHRGKLLHKWLHNNRHYYKNRSNGSGQFAISDSRAEKMLAAGMLEDGLEDVASCLAQIPLKPKSRSRCFSLSVDDKWEELFQALVGFKKEFEHTVVPFGTTRDGQPLGFWVRVQQNAYHNASKNLMPVLSRNRRERLTSIDFDFLSEQAFEAQTAKLSTEQKWQDTCYALYFFRQDYGDIRIAKEFVHAGKSLATWAKNNHQRYRNRVRGLAFNVLTDGRAQTMECLGLIAALTSSGVQTKNAGELVELPLRNAVDQILSAVFSDAGAEPGDEGNTKCKGQEAEHAEVDATSSGGDSEPVLINEEYDDVACRRMENELIDLLDRSIYIAEEKELLDSLEREIGLAEIEAVERPVALVNEGRFVPESNRHGRGVHEESATFSPDNELVPEFVRVTKLLPRYVGSSKERFATFEEVEENLVRNLKDGLTQEELLGFCVQVEMVPGDEMTVCLEVESQGRVVEAFRSRLQSWCDAKLRRLTFLKLFDDGIRLSVDLDPSIQLGAQVMLFSTYKDTPAGMLVGVQDANGQLAKGVGVHMLRHGAALIALNGKPCTSFNDFVKDLREESSLGVGSLAWV